MTDQILIQKLHVMAHIGVTAQERKTEQPLHISVALDVVLDDDELVDRDHIESTVNYSTVAKAILARFEGVEYRLIETAAVHVARVCLEWSEVTEVDVTVEKPRALASADCAAVRIRRGR